MDTNYLLKREQISLMMAARAKGVEARFAHFELARGYGAMLVAKLFPHRPFNNASAEELNGNENPDRGRSDV